MCTDTVLQNQIFSAPSWPYRITDIGQSTFVYKTGHFFIYLLLKAVQLQHFQLSFPRTVMGPVCVKLRIVCISVVCVLNKISFAFRLRCIFFSRCHFKNYVIRQFSVCPWPQHHWNAWVLRLYFIRKFRIFFLRFNITGWETGTERR